MEILATIAVYLIAALVGAVTVIWLCMSAIDRIPNLREGAGGFLLILLLGLTLVVGGPVGAALGIALVYAYRTSGVVGVGIVLGGLLLLGGAFWLYRQVQQAHEQAEMREYAALFDRTQHDIESLLNATRAGSLSAVTAVLGRGVFVDSYYTHDPLFGETALMIAARAGNLPLVGLLLERGALPDLRNDRGQTPEMLARQNGHGTVAALLAHAEGDGRDPAAPAPGAD